MAQTAASHSLRKLGPRARHAACGSSAEWTVLPQSLSRPSPLPGWRPGLPASVQLGPAWLSERDSKRLCLIWRRRMRLLIFRNFLELF